VVRPKTFIGTERLGVFQILCDWVRLGKRIPIIGSGHNRYQLLEVTDLVSAILLLATSKPTINDTFNVGAQHFATVREDVGALCEFAGSGSRPFPVPSLLVKPALRALEALHLSPLYRWVYDTADKDSFVSIDKLKSLGWQPKFSNSQALIHMYKWYLKHYQEVESQSGTTHRVGWDQGVLGFLKKFL
jgi:nucleoside-diphosphate-sugar epimerase